jgi:hypothetical protein
MYRRRPNTYVDRVLANPEYIGIEMNIFMLYR